MVAGVATRLGLPYEQMDDLQLAVETVLGRTGERATIELIVEEDALRIHVGPVASAALDDEDGDEELDLRRLLGALVERVDVVEQDGREWLRLEDGIRAA